MADLSDSPRIYEINTWVWLNTLSQQYKRKITLHNIPSEILDELASYRIDAIWLMGIWYRGRSTRASALNYIHEYRGALPDVTKKDIAGSAYAIGAYDIEETLGGRDGLAAFRQQLQLRGLKLILDFVPNHTGLDHPWLYQHPEYYLQADESWVERARGEFFKVAPVTGDEITVAHGRDPYFPGWIDTAQLNAYSPAYRQAVVSTLREIAAMADGVRCDMAMLMMNHVFQHTWGWLHPDMKAPAMEFWDYVIPAVKEFNPRFIFIAEAYWNLNYALLEQGFDYTYDKTTYDRLLSGDVNGLYTHFSADLSYLKRQIRFIENHDERRAMDAFGLERSRAAATLIATVPGALLLHDGQFTGRKIKLPVHITRQPAEREYPQLKQFYLRLMYEIEDEIYRQGQWQLFRCYAACDGCEGDYNIMAYGWRYEDDIRLVVLNLSGEWSQAAIDLSPWADLLAGTDWRLLDVLHRTYVEEPGEIMNRDGLRVDMEPFQAAIYQFAPMKRRVRRPFLMERRMS
jgi:hypothetical protein